MKATVLTTLIVVSTLIVLYLTGQMKTKGLMHEDLIMIPRRQSNYTVLSSSMELKKLNIPDWISCPPAVILAFV